MRYSGAGYGYPSSDVNSGVGLVPNSNGRYHGGMTRIRTLNGVPTQTQRACPARAPTSTQRLDLNTKCPPVPVFALYFDGLEMRLVGQPATRVRIPLAPRFP